MNLARLNEKADLMLAAAAVGILALMIIPVPPRLLDLLLAFNITLPLVILLVAMYTLQALEFSAFPSLLLIATLFRLALNISSTRLILLHGDEWAGVMVTRAASETNMGKELTSQLLVHPRAMGMASATLFGFGIIPGLPTLPFLVLSGLAGAMTYATSKQTAPTVDAEVSAPSSLEVPEKIESLLPLDVLELQVGCALIPLVDVGQDGELLERIKSIHRQCAQEMGIVVPPLHIRDNLQLNPAEYAVLLKGVQIARGELMPNHYLAMNPGPAKGSIPGLPHARARLWTPSHLDWRRYWPVGASSVAVLTHDSRTT